MAASFIASHAFGETNDAEIPAVVQAIPHVEPNVLYAMLCARGSLPNNPAGRCLLSRLSACYSRLVDRRSSNNPVAVSSGVFGHRRHVNLLGVHDAGRRT